MEDTRGKGVKGFSAFLVAVAIVSLVVGGVCGYWLGFWTLSGKIKGLEGKLSTLQEQFAKLQPTKVNSTYLLEGNISLADLYRRVRDSVVIVRGVVVQYDVWGVPHYTLVQGSGFTYNFTGKNVVITNSHVVQGVSGITVTFTDGDGYAATLLGSDPYADLAVLSVDAPKSEFKPLEIANSSTLKVGDVVVAVGNPYGLAGSMSIGIVSALGRTITEEQTGGYLIANVIQTTAP
ncbi:MAG: trypsin-like peptidase domain-containing protein, partial [Candidatus Bathyarchaeia archaeon]